MDFPGKNTGVGCHFLLQGIFPGEDPGTEVNGNFLLMVEMESFYCLTSIPFL